MRLVILDYNGTLDTLNDPVSFVESLRAQGDFVVLWSSTSKHIIDRRYPGLYDSFDDVKEKIIMQEVLNQVRKAVSIDSVVLSDDDENIARLSKRLNGRYDGTPWTYVAPKDLLSLIK